jgi:ubiquinone/menaquinone biosynthesis C-methylase UbiE
LGVLGKIIYSTISSKEEVEKHQQSIRNAEWDSVYKYIPLEAKFLDVGCGAGYAMKMARETRHCESSGIDPEPRSHGVGRYVNTLVQNENILQGFAESLPFDDQTFDVVYSSHVLEHVNDEQKSLSEMRRVLKDDGILIIGVPTATMTVIGIISNILFLTHIKIYEAILDLFRGKNFLTKVKSIFVIGSHSYPRAKSVFYDLHHYKVKNWQKIISNQFVIHNVIEPYLYPYPDYIQFFRMHKSRLGASSVFFICKKLS